MKRHMLFAAALPILLAGCDHPEHLNAGFGESVTHNKLAHIIDPAPVYAGNVLLNGKRGALGIDRYEKGEVIPPRDLRTSDVGLITE